MDTDGTAVERGNIDFSSTSDEQEAPLKIDRRSAEVDPKRWALLGVG
jgi:hypothetical protein